MSIRDPLPSNPYAMCRRHAVLAADQQRVPGLRRVHGVHQPRGGVGAAARLAVPHAGAVRSGAVASHRPAPALRRKASDVAIS